MGKSKCWYKKIDSKPVYNKQFLKTKMKSQSDEVTGFSRQEKSKGGL